MHSETGPRHGRCEDRREKADTEREVAVAAKQAYGAVLVYDGRVEYSPHREGKRDQGGKLLDGQLTDCAFISMDSEHLPDQVRF